MPFNPDDYTKAPWAGGVMTLTHDECMYVKDKCKTIIDAFVATDEQPACDDFYVVSHYNRLDWAKSINGDTYSELKEYDTDTMVGGIPLEA